MLTVGEKMLKMKFINFVITILILTIFFLLNSCAQYTNKQTTNDQLCGIWTWQSSSGGITGKQRMTPETKGYTKTIEFTPFGEYREFHDDILVISTGYTIERKKTIFGHYHDVICFSNTVTNMMDQVIMKLDDCELCLTDPCPDCFGHAYTRTK
jgi:hypothetical protein